MKHEHLANAADEGDTADIKQNTTIRGRQEILALYRFLQGTADQYMTRAVTVRCTQQTTMRELEALFEKHDFNSFPVVEEGKMLGIVSKIDLRAFGLHYWSDGAAIR